ncbi:tetratricopeptide repeat protein [Dyadobacter sp. CY343]|uniref:tetratricopeptide repeat protein n=1 Tax=Dyadobacter sp. CY343 TaxID=2907299 RepID=UPI001F3E23CE|nr:tetratricopeptide repeat protein [Dyadobacter sp. CY343]MCE7059218.1 tetratricopeptide repeat protein [Dyadobacter sp. CY343]
MKNFSALNFNTQSKNARIVRNIYSLTIIICILAPPPLLAADLQDTLNQRDNNEVKLLAQRKIEKGLSDLLNTITFEDLGAFERKSITADSYGESPNKVFYDEKVIIENDLNPEFTSAGNSADLPVDKYLNNFELFYPKSIERTIELTDFQVSDLKKSNYYYVKVFFTSHFKGKHNQINVPYQPVKRVAEVRAEKKGKKWITYISQIAFYTEKDSLNANLNNVEFIADSTATVSEQSVSQPSETDIARQKEREAERRALEIYNKWLTDGDNAFKEGDFDKALEAYTEAEKLNNYEDLLPRRKIYQVKRAFEKARQTKAELVGQYLAKASIAQKKRNYSEAIGHLQEAFDLLPDSVQLAETIKMLNQKSSLKTELDEKFNSGMYDEVIKDYSRILKKEKDNSDHYLGRGIAYVMVKEEDKAFKDLSKAIELDYANLAALRARAELYTAIKDYPKAAADFTSYLNIDNTADEMLIKRAQLRVLTRNVSGALEDYQRAIQIAPQNASHYHQRGLLFFNSNEFSKATADFSAALERDTLASDSYYFRGLSHIERSEIERAGKDFAQVRRLKITPERDEKITAIALSFFHQGTKSLRKGEFTEAIANYDSAIHVKPTVADFWYHKASGHLGMRDSAAALTAYDKALFHHAEFAEAFLGRAKLWFAMEEYAKASVDYNRAYQISPVLYEARIGEGNAFFELRQYEKAATAYEFIKVNEKKIGAGMSDSLYAVAYNKLGLTNLALNKIEKAIEEYDRAINKTDQLAEIYFNRGEANRLQGNLKKAISDFRRATALDPKNPAYNIQLGITLEKDERYADAIVAFSEAIKIDTANSCCRSIAMLKRADNLVMLKKYLEAISDYQASFESDSSAKTPASLVNFGTAYIKINQPGEAVEILSRISNRDELRGTAYYLIGCAMVQQKKNDEALRWFEKSFTTGLITKAFLRKDRMLEDIDKAFANSVGFKELVSRHVLR